MILRFSAPPTFHTVDIAAIVTACYDPSSPLSLLSFFKNLYSSTQSTHDSGTASWRISSTLQHQGQSLEVIGHAKGIETAPLALLRLRMLMLDSVSSSPCSSDFLSASVARKRSVTVSHSSGSSSNRKPTQMMQVAARRTTLKITSCFSTSIAKDKNVGKQKNSEEGFDFLMVAYQ